MGRKNWKHVEHAPEWVPAPLKIDRVGNTRPGFLCIHELENGNGLCASNWFEEDTSPHTCVVMLRGRWNISRPCYDKYRRCPGWAGGGWKGGKHRLCHEDKENLHSGYLNVNYGSRWWRWKFHRFSNCDVLVLPYVVRYTSPRSWYYGIKFSRNSWNWLINLETWWGKKTGRW